MVSFFSTVLSAIFHFLVAKLVSFALTLWRLHVTANKTLEKQGVSGPKPSSWITGNAAEIRDLARQTSSQDMDSINHNLVPRLLPFEHKNSAIYGKRFLAWTVGWEPTVNIAEPQLIQQVLTSAEFEKSGIQNKFMSALFGKGIIMASGKEWEHQRKLVTPAFYADKIKEMQETMNSCAGDLVERWTQLIKKDQTEIDAYIEFNSVSAEIIARTAFGNKYEKKDEYVYLEHELQDAVMKQSPFSLIPGYSYLPTRGNKRIWKLNKRIRTCLEELIEIRLKRAGGDPYLLGNDILCMLLQRFQWKLSANYRHSPQASTAVFPKHGMQLIVSNNSSET